MSKFNKMFKLIMESINTNFHDLFEKIKNHEDKDLLISWVEAIEENNIIPNKEFSINDMEKFEDTLTQDQLDKVIELGVEILQSVEGDEEDINNNTPTNHLGDHIKSEHEEDVNGYTVNFVEFDDSKWSYQLNTKYNSDFDPESQVDGEWYPPIDAMDPELFYDSLERARDEAADEIDNQIAWGNINNVGQ